MLQLRRMARSRRKRSNTFGKRGVKHSGTILANNGAGSTPAKLIVLKTGGGPRSTTGSPMTIQSFSSTDDDCKTGDIVKFINLHIQSGSRNTVEGAADRVGWLEWAFICVRENETEVPITNAGTQTLGDICTQMYRGECIYTGAIPVGDVQPVVGEISLKIPKTKQGIKLGDEWRFVTYFRAVGSISTSTIANRLIKSYNYIVKS